MLYILAALKCEASSLNGLDGEVVVTGVGKKALDVISALELSSSDRVLNIGICAGKNKGKGYLVNQVISQETGRRYYPDILFETGIDEISLTTSSGIVTEVEDGMLYDMEAALICDEALKIIPPSNLAVYKVVSDSGDSFPSPKEVAGLISKNLKDIKKIVSYLSAGGETKRYEFLPDDIEDKLRLTQYMRNELKDIEHYCAVSGREEELSDLLKKLEEQGRLPVKDKRSGREVLDEIYSYLR